MWNHHFKEMEVCLLLKQHLFAWRCGIEWKLMDHLNARPLFARIAFEWWTAISCDWKCWATMNSMNLLQHNQLQHLGFEPQPLVEVKTPFLLDLDELKPTLETRSLAASTMPTFFSRFWVKNRSKHTEKQRKASGSPHLRTGLWLAHTRICNCSDRDLTHNLDWLLTLQMDWEKPTPPHKAIPLTTTPTPALAGGTKRVSFWD